MIVTYLLRFSPNNKIHILLGFDIDTPPTSASAMLYSNKYPICLISPHLPISLPFQYLIDSMHLADGAILVSHPYTKIHSLPITLQMEHLLFNHAANLGDSLAHVSVESV